MDIDFLVEQVHRLLLDNLPIRTSKTPSGWNTMDCPMCTDKRKRGGLITTGAKISYNCFNCGFTTGWEPNPTLGKKYKDLAIKLGANNQDIHKVTIELMKYSEELETESATDYVYNLQKFNTEQTETAMAVDDLPDEHAVKGICKTKRTTWSISTAIL